MAEKTRVELKEYFETGDVPTELQFVDLIDSFYNLRDNSFAGSDDFKVFNRQINVLNSNNSRYAPNIGGDRHAMMPRILKNPINGIISTIYRVGTSHISLNSEIILRRSLDGGKTFHGINPLVDYTIIVEEAGIDVRNVGTFYTKTGRLIIIYMRYTGSSFLDSYYKWSDDDGTTWSNTSIFTPPPAYSTAQYMYPFSNKCLYDNENILLYPYHLKDITNQYRWMIARSTNNGETWDTSQEVYDSQSVTASGGEFVIEDFGNGVFIGISRNNNIPDPSGYLLPFTVTSTDWGQNWAGTNPIVTKTDLDNKAHLSGWLRLEGNKTLAASSGYNDTCLPDICKLIIDGKIYIGIPYYKRDDGIEETIQKMTFVLLKDFLLSGVDAFVSSSVITLYNSVYTGTPDGNGSCLVLNDNELLYILGQGESSSVETIILITLFNNDIIEIPFFSNILSGVWKEPVRAFEGVSNLTLSGHQTIDGVALITGDTIGVFGQTVGLQNGVYIVDTGAWTRHIDWIENIKAASFSFFVQEGTSQADTQKLITNNKNSDTIGTDILSITTV